MYHHLDAQSLLEVDLRMMNCENLRRSARRRLFFIEYFGCRVGKGTDRFFGRPYEGLPVLTPIWQVDV